MVGEVNMSLTREMNGGEAVRETETNELGTAEGEHGNVGQDRGTL